MLVKVSIIVPVYNSEKYIKKCIKSVCDQDYMEWKLLLIDDGCTDNSRKIIDEMSASDSRIETYHLKNSGVSNARNYGLSKVKTPYVMFLDSDDELNSGALNALVRKIDADVDFVIGCYNREYVNTNIVKSSVLNSEKDSLLTGNITKDYWSLESLLTVPVAKIYKTEIIKKNNLLFPIAMSTSEDQWFNYKYIEFVKKYIYIPVVVYKYKIRSDEISLSKKTSKKYFISELVNLRYKINFFTKYNTPRKEEMINRYINAVLTKFTLSNANKISYDVFENYVKILSEYVQRERLFPLSKRKIICRLIKYRCDIIMYAYYKTKKIICEIKKEQQMK